MLLSPYVEVLFIIIALFSLSLSDLSVSLITDTVSGLADRKISEGHLWIRTVAISWTVEARLSTGLTMALSTLLEVWGFFKGTTHQRLILSTITTVSGAVARAMRGAMS